MSKRVVLMAVLSCAWIAPGAHAAMAVVDIRAIDQLITQIETLREQLAQAQATYQSMTGQRGMEQLLSGMPRNYLPPDWVTLDAVLRQASASYRALAEQVESTLAANAVLTPQQVARLSTEERMQLEEARRGAAMLQVTTRQALETTSSRFEALQQLVDAIGAAQDQKSVLDLQARISAEQAMLQNEQTKLVLLFHTAQAEEWARRQRAREHAIASIGSLRRLPAIGLND